MPRSNPTSKASLVDGDGFGPHPDSENMIIVTIAERKVNLRNFIGLLLNETAV